MPLVYIAMSDKMSFMKALRIEGTLQGKILALLVEGPLAGSDLMKQLNIRSPGTIYPALKLLREKGLQRVL